MLKTAALALLLMSLASPALAKDAVQAAVTPLGSQVPIIVENGNPYAKGTFALGTIQLWYTVNAYQFPAGRSRPSGWTCWPWPRPANP